MILNTTRGERRFAWRMRLAGLAVLPVLALGLLAACGGDSDDGDPTTVPTGGTSAADTTAAASPASGTPPATSAPGETPTAEPTPTAVTLERPTENPEVDAVLAALVSGDPKRIRPFVGMSTLPCTTAEGAGGPPKCPEGTEDGERVRAFAMLRTSLEWDFDTDRAVETLSEMTAYTGVFRAAPSAYFPRTETLPSGSYVVVTEGGQLVHIAGGQIVFIDFALGGLDAKLAEVGENDFILPIE